MLFDQPPGTTSELQHLLRSASEQGPSPERSSPSLYGPKMPGKEGSSPRVQRVSQEGQSRWVAVTGAAAQHIVHILQTSIKYSGFVFVSLSLPLCVSLPEDLFLRMKSCVQLSSFNFGGEATPFWNIVVWWEHLIVWGFGKDPFSFWVSRASYYKWDWGLFNTGFFWGKPGWCSRSVWNAESCWFSWASARVGGIHCLAGQVLCCPLSSSNSHLQFYF